jgi:UPF0176 protein
MTQTVSAFYRFVAIVDPALLRDQVEVACRHYEIKGTILVAREGINGTVAGSVEGISGLEDWLRSDPRFRELSTKRSSASEEPFKKLKVKVKSEIVTFGAAGADPTVRPGIYVSPEHWNALISDPDVTLIDTRNSYEVAVGTFPSAINPGTRAFSEFPEFVAASLDPSRNRKVAMFCTGGIRCEKASAYLLSQGFEQVFHLEGGILKYLETVPTSQSLWHGECFVFDERVALQHGLGEGSHDLCTICGHPVSRDTTARATPVSSTHCQLCAR